jgi:hypothetical protein
MVFVDSGSSRGKKELKADEGQGRTKVGGELVVLARMRRCLDERFSRRGDKSEVLYPRKWSLVSSGLASIPLRHRRESFALGQDVCCDR